jgi:hypothetical protein
MGLGGSPSTRTRRSLLASPGLAEGTAESRAQVYGWSGRWNKAILSACSTIFPEYMTAISSQTYWTTPKS